MHIQDFNKNAAVADALQPSPDTSLNDAQASRMEPGETRDRTEITLLKKRIEHLELVVETARSLMTSNQERLLRRLHDLPQELMALTAALSRSGRDGAAPEPQLQPIVPAEVRRVA